MLIFMKGVSRMPIKKVKGGYKFGDKGKVYSTRAQAVKQGQAIKANQSKENNKKN